MKASINKIKSIIREFSTVEKVTFSILAFLFLWSAFMLLYSLGDTFRKDFPMRGGELHEGIIGYPNFINPLFSYTNTGKDLSYLTYSGLMRIDEKGTLTPDLAESYTVSNDGTVYTFILKDNIRFHDGSKLTSADVMFTIETAKDPNINSPVAPNWQGVAVKVVDDRTITFTLRTPYTPFLENTTLGILPKHIWQGANLDQFKFSPYNFNPIGSGPYKVEEVKRKTNGFPSLYTLSAWKEYPTGEKNITTLYLHVYPDTTQLLNALRNGEIESVGDISPTDGATLAKEGYEIKTADLLRIFGVFFNQNQATIFTDKSVKLALDTAVDRTRIIDRVLYSYGNEEDTPLPGKGLQASPTEQETLATDILHKNGWKENSEGIMEKKDSKGTKVLSFTLTTSNNPELVATAELLRQDWSAIGAKVTVVSLDASELTETVIKPRKYDALLFGEITGRGKDLYPFWFSGERKDPGFNIALYTNTKADNILQKARTATSTAETEKYLSAFIEIFREDRPAIFLYSPKYIYVVPKKIKGLELPPLEMSHERFAGIISSYIKTKRVWK